MIDVYSLISLYFDNQTWATLGTPDNVILKIPAQLKSIPVAAKKSTFCCCDVLKIVAGTHCMNNISCWKIIALSQFCFSCLAD